MTPGGCEPGKMLLMYSNDLPTSDHVNRLQACAGRHVLVLESEEQAIAEAADAEVILGHRYLRQAIPGAKSLRWVQSTAAGVQHLISEELRKANPLLTRCPIFSEVVAWHAFTLALSLIRAVPQAVEAQKLRTWEPPTDMLPIPRSAMVLGLGDIGCALGQRLRRNGIEVIGVARRFSEERQRSCDRLLLDGTWRQDLSGLDLLFLTLPLTPHTRGLVNKEVLAALPRHAVVVNIGRPQVLEMDALVDRLRAGALGGAAADVLEPIPPKTDLLWATPGLLITPKISTYSRGRRERLERFIEAQVLRYVRGEPLLHQVDLARVLA